MKLKRRISRVSERADGEYSPIAKASDETTEDVLSIPERRRLDDPADDLQCEAGGDRALASEDITQEDQNESTCQATKAKQNVSQCTLLQLRLRRSSALPDQPYILPRPHHRSRNLRH